MKGVLGVILFGMILLSGCFADLDVDNHKGELIEGAYHMLANTGDEFRCYCDNGGYVETIDGTKHPVCFSQIEKVKCNYITLRAEQTVKSIVPSLTSQCPVGEMAYYKVLSHECLEEMPSPKNTK